MRAIRHRLSDILLELLRRVYPSEQPQARVWQIIEVPRRITKTEAEQLASSAGGEPVKRRKVVTL